MKWGIFVYTSGKTSKRMRCINKTWGKNLDNLYFFTDTDVYKDNVIKCTDDDTYDSNVEKNLCAIKYAQENDFDWAFFVGDDVYVFVDNFMRYIETKNSGVKSVYGEIIHGTWPKDRTLSYLCGGGGILFPKSSLNEIVNVMEEPESYRDFKYADVVIGLLMKKSGLNMVDVELLIKGNPPEYYNITKPERYIAFHFINTEEQFDMLWSRDEANRNNK
jgi:hypothetical protein